MSEDQKQLDAFDEDVNEALLTKRKIVHPVIAFLNHDLFAIGLT